MTLLQVLIVFICLFQVIKSDWVDPHSMDSSTKSQLNSFNNPKSSHSKEEYCSSIKTRNADIYLKRIVRLILNNAHLDKNDLDDFTGHINLQFSKKEYEFLLNFSLNDDTHEDVFGEVGSIFEVALQKPSLERYKEVIFTVEEQIYFIIFNPTTGALVGFFILLYIIYKLLRAKFTWKSILKYLIFLMYVADFIITYLEIRKDEEIKNIVATKRLGTMPPECNPQKLSWFKYIKTQFESTFFEHPCKAYYEMVAHDDLKYLVAPTKILTRQFRTLLVEPVGDIGEAFGKFGRHMFTNLPWGLNIAIFPIMLIASCLIIFIILLFITKPRFKISLFRFFTLEIGDSHRPEPRHEAITMQRGVEDREVGYNAEHRAFIEDASNDDCSSNERDGSNVKNVQKGIGANAYTQTDDMSANNELNCSSVDKLDENTTKVES